MIFCRVNILSGVRASSYQFDIHLEFEFSYYNYIRMSRTRLHTDIAKLKKGVIEYDEVSKETKRHFDRYNFDYAEDKCRQNKIKEKILKNELRYELSAIRSTVLD